MNNIIIIVILILLFITSDTVAIPTFFPIDNNYTRKNNTIENEQTLKALLYLDKIQFETKNLRAYQINKIYNMNHKKNNSRRQLAELSGLGRFITADDMVVCASRTEVSWGYDMIT